VNQPGPQAHWEHIYQSEPPTQLGWYLPACTRSLALIHQANLPCSAPVIDAGGGASTLVDDLLAEGYTGLTVLDISQTALEISRKRLKAEAGQVTWMQADLLSAVLPGAFYRLWHDRAVFHFLTSPEQRLRYRARLEHALAPGGWALLATFDLDGPAQCSGLPVQRYSPESLLAELGAGFQLIQSAREIHLTPGGSRQSYQYSLLQKQ
jgi:SAM-dependent methyltransferase